MLKEKNLFYPVKYMIDRYMRKALDGATGPGDPEPVEPPDYEEHRIYLYPWQYVQNIELVRDENFRLQEVKGEYFTAYLTYNEQNFLEQVEYEVSYGTATIQLEYDANNMLVKVHGNEDFPGEEFEVPEPESI